MAKSIENQNFCGWEFGKAPFQCPCTSTIGKHAAGGEGDGVGDRQGRFGNKCWWLSLRWWWQVGWQGGAQGGKGQKCWGWILYFFRGASFWSWLHVVIKKAPLKFQTNCVSPPDFFLLRSRTIFYLKKPPLKNEAIKNAPRKTKLQNKCPPEICTARPHGGSAQKQPYLTSQFRGALLTQSVTLEFSQDTGCNVCWPSLSWLSGENTDKTSFGKTS